MPPSLSSLHGTQFIFTCIPLSSAASTAASTRASPSSPVICSNTDGSSVSKLMFTRFSPACFSASIYLSKSRPFVVSAMSEIPARPFTSPISFTRFLRTSGSPPVKRIFFTPSDSIIRTTLKISSSVSTSSCGITATPCLGIQYLHRRLHLSVTEIRR